MSPPSFPHAAVKGSRQVPRVAAREGGGEAFGHSLFPSEGLGSEVAVSSGKGGALRTAGVLAGAVGQAPSVARAARPWWPVPAA